MLLVNNLSYMWGLFLTFFDLDWTSKENKQNIRIYFVLIFWNPKHNTAEKQDNLF